MKTTAIVFDIGNVLLPFDLDLALKRILARSERASAEALGHVHRLKDDLECGTIEASLFFEEIEKSLGFEGTREELVAAWEDIFSPNEPMWEFVRSVSGRIPLFLLSNTNDPHVRYMFRTYPVFSLFDGGVYSHEAKCAKPGEEIYRLAEAKFDLVPAKTIYLDDLSENIATPLRLGWDAIQYDCGKHGDFTAAMSERKLL